MIHIYHFLSSAFEVFSMCCALCILREDYWKPIKITIIVGLLAGCTTILDAMNVDINVGVNILLIIVLLKLLYNASILEAIFDAFCSAMLVVGIEMVTTYIICLLAPKILDNKLIMILYLVLLASLFLIVLKRAKNKKRIQTCYKKYQKGIWIICLNFLFIQAAELYNWNQTNTIDSSIIVLVLITITVNLILAFKLIKNQQQKEELQNQQRLMELKEDFLHQMAAEQHDFAKHLQAIQNILEECKSKDDLEAAKAYVGELVNLRHQKQRTVYVGDGVLSAYLNGKRSEAAERNINFSILVKNPIPEFPCTQSDLVEVAGNLIDNAFDAVDGLSPELKKVFFEIGMEEGTAFLRTMNSLLGEEVDPNKMLAKGFSTKKGNLRGYGLSNIKAITEKYSGKIEIQMNEDVIVIKVLFK